MAQIRERIGKRGTRYMAVVRRRGRKAARTFDTREQAEAWAAQQEALLLGTHYEQICPWCGGPTKFSHDDSSYVVDKKENQ